MKGSLPLIPKLKLNAPLLAIALVGPLVVTIILQGNIIEKLGNLEFGVKTVARAHPTMLLHPKPHATAQNRGSLILIRHYVEVSFDLLAPQDMTEFLALSLLLRFVVRNRYPFKIILHRQLPPPLLPEKTPILTPVGALLISYVLSRAVPLPTHPLLVVPPKVIFFLPLMVL